jgi:hypothetical protein
MMSSLRKRGEGGETREIREKGEKGRRGRRKGLTIFLLE